MLREMSEERQILDDLTLHVGYREAKQEKTIDFCTQSIDLKLRVNREEPRRLW